MSDGGTGAHEARLGFGLSPSGEVTLMSELLPEEYGERCGLSCPECGAPLQAVRRFVGGQFAGWKCLRHVPGSSVGCTGYGERSSHMLAEELFVRSIGGEMKLPAVSALDAVPHVSRISDRGAWRTGREGTRAWDADSPRKWSLGEELVPDVEVLPSQTMRIVNVRREVRVRRGLVADLVVTLGRPGATDGRHADVAVEIRYTHQKDLEHAVAYMEAGMSVIEILVRDIQVDSPDAVDRLRERLLGTDAVDRRREWLWNRSAMGLADKQFRLAWTVDDSRLPPDDGTGRPVTADAIHAGCERPLWQRGYRDVADVLSPSAADMDALMTERRVPVTLVGTRARSDGRPYCRYAKASVIVGFVAMPPSRPKESLYHAQDLMVDVLGALGEHVRERGRYLHSIGY